MKKFLILFLSVGILATACNNKAKEAKTETTKDDYRNIDNKDKEKEDKTTSTDDNGSTGTGWTSADRAQWMKVCADPLKESMGEEKATNYCDCVLGKIQQKYPTFDKANTMGTEQEGMDMGKECIKELGYQVNQ